MVTGLQHQPPDEQTLTAHRWLADDPEWPRRAPLMEPIRKNTIRSSSARPVHAATIGQGLGVSWWSTRQGKGNERIRKSPKFHENERPTPKIDEVQGLKSVA